MVIAPKIKLNNGEEMPVLGLGTYLAPNEDCERAVKYAIDCGYRHIDTAYVYHNEEAVGKAINDKIKEGVVKREDLYIVTKLPSSHHQLKSVEIAFHESLQKLGLDYVDLYLIHFPVGKAKISGKTVVVDYVETWKGMEKLVKLNLVKSIGLSNFNSQQTDKILANCEIKPVTNQVECHPGFNQKKLIEFSKQRDIVITAYCPLGRPDVGRKTPAYLFDDKMKAIAKKYNKTTAQVVLRYLVDIGTVPIPKSVTEKRIAENIDIFDFKLTEEDIAIIDSYNTTERICPFTFMKGDEHFPFNTEF